MSILQHTPKIVHLDLDNVSKVEKLFFYCEQLSISVCILKDAINRHKSHKTNKVYTTDRENTEYLND